VPGAPDELEMCDGDFIFMEEKELEISTDGWYLGTSWMTGCTGMFPGVYTERTAETETWTMHRSLHTYCCSSSDFVQKKTVIMLRTVFTKYSAVVIA